jgi:hypothetical protein
MSLLSGARGHAQLAAFTTMNLLGVKWASCEINLPGLATPTRIALPRVPRPALLRWGF